MSEVYSRQQAIVMASSDSNRVKYLEKAGLVLPQKIGEGEGKKPVVLYTLEQIEQIKLINEAASFLHLEGIRRAIADNRLKEIVHAIAALPTQSRSVSRDS